MFGEGERPPSPVSVDNVGDLTAGRSGERDRCLRRDVCALGVDLVCVRLVVVELMRGVGFSRWVEDMKEENGDGRGLVGERI